MNYTNEVTEPVTTCFGESFRFHLIPTALVVFPRKGPLSKGFRVKDQRWKRSIRNKQNIPL